MRKNAGAHAARHQRGYALDVGSGRAQLQRMRGFPKMMLEPPRDERTVLVVVNVRKGKAGLPQTIALSPQSFPKRLMQTEIELFLKDLRAFNGRMENKLVYDGQIE